MIPIPRVGQTRKLTVPLESSMISTPSWRPPRSVDFRQYPTGPSPSSRAGMQKSEEENEQPVSVIVQLCSICRCQSVDVGQELRLQGKDRIQGAFGRLHAVHHRIHQQGLQRKLA